MHKAAQFGQSKICYMLVASGANLTMRDADGNTPMMLAFQYSHYDLATYLESKTKYSIPFLEIVATI